MNKDDKILQSLHSIHFYPILKELKEIVNGEDLNAMKALHLKTLNLLYEASFNHSFDYADGGTGCCKFSFKYAKYDYMCCNKSNVSTLFGHTKSNRDFPQIIHRPNPIIVCDIERCYLNDKEYKRFYGYKIRKDYSIIDWYSKPTLQEFCDENDISYKSTDRKIKLIKKLMSI